MERGVDNTADIPLTPREREVAELVSAGLTNAEIAERLNLTFATAKWHVSQVLAKLEVDHREAVGARLVAVEERRQRTRRWQFSLAPLLSMKVFGAAAAVVPFAAVTVFAAAVFWSGRDDSTNRANASTPEPPPVATIPVREIDALNRVLLGDGPDCNLAGRDLGGLWGHNFTFAGCDLREARLTGAGLNDADFSDANLEGADLSQATVGGADFTGANLRDVTIRDAIAQGADFTNANLTGADFFNTIVAGAIWDGAICPDGRPAAETGTCIGRPGGLENPPTTRSYDVLETGLIVR